MTLNAETAFAYWVVSAAVIFMLGYALGWHHKSEQLPPPPAASSGRAG